MCNDKTHIDNPVVQNRETLAQEDDELRGGVSRRDFLKTGAIGAAAGALVAPASRSQLRTSVSGERVAGPRGCHLVIPS
jgi:hypothetical protein